MSETATLAIGGSPILLREIAYRPLDEHARHRHGHCSITLILAGTLEEGAHSAMRRFDAFSIVTKPAGVYHQDRFGPRGTRTFQLAFTAESAREFCPEMTYGWQCGGPIARAMLDLFCAAREDANHENGVIEVLTAVADHSAPGRDPHKSMVVEMLKDYLDTEACNHISIRGVAGEFGMHPVSLARAFRRHTGCSITEYVRRRRIANACALIHQQDLPLAHIAAATGFADQPHFTRVFRTETGLTPAAYRHKIAKSTTGSNRSRLRRASPVR